MKMAARQGCVALSLVLAGCQAEAQGAACPLSGQVRLTDLRLYFGRTLPGGGIVDDAAWKGFAARVLTPAFPEGFTVTGAMGQWRDPRSGEVVREASFVLERVGQVKSDAVDGVIAAYRTQFHQVSVGRLTTIVCAAF